MHVPREREPERQVDREPDERDGEHPDAEERPQPHDELREPDPDPDDERMRREHAHQRSHRIAVGEARELAADEVGSAAVQDVRVEELVHAGVDEGDAEEGAKDPQRPRHRRPRPRDRERAGRRMARS